ncbi:thioredoxin domain-containing protein [Thiohalobacter sp. IOR34]|uniref:thioredoxin domain-containing protein n=1 Tax=Thiohalobacter sp. IOR34 TaxID=3057176 RepID=UPI0025AEDEC1|nr:thioredoxin domain-containing protein [Thiohalobacter sp. IOR34]WJW75887.1 thioredoxin domain-containing protein [Thiohalobacter sp. IOR34]
MHDPTTPGNRLAGETSPYLLQHAENPVAWQPWDSEALALARELDRPILLSIGYSACHWCHVMAHECFEDPALAALMNRLFVNIKVDREERPDLDRIYQNAHSLLTQRPGGWPLTVFLTPDDRIPFFAGTYFPSRPRHGLPGFGELLEHIATLYRERRNEIEAQNAELLEALQSLAVPPPAAGPLTPLPLDVARNQLEQQFEPRHGGFGGAPKFPHPTSLERLLRHWARSRASGTADSRALEMVEISLQRMAHGGLYDQIGGGFYRYSVDAQWEIPHFEKMLYDNAALLALYAETHAATGRALFARIARETAEWTLREMQAPEGGFYSALDADSEGGEGHFYLWTPEAVRAQVAAEDYPLVAARFGLDRAANFEGRWHLRVCATADELARRFGLTPEQVGERLAVARRRLAGSRAERTPPGRDDKILTAWNALTIRGLAIAARHLRQPAWGEAATAALDFIRNRLWRDGRLLASYRDGQARHGAYLDDHAYLLDAILELLQLRWRAGELDFAIELAELLLSRFEDPKGGFFFTADDHEHLIQRSKPAHDEAIPAGNGVALRALLRLGRLLGEPRYLAAAERGLEALGGALAHNPHACGSLLTALEEWLYPGATLILRGEPQLMAGWGAAQDFAPGRLRLVIPPGAGPLPGLLGEQPAADRPIAYVCRDGRCLPPAKDARTLRELLA